MHESQVLFHVFGLGITSIIITTMALTLGLSLLAIIASKRLEKSPGRLQNFLELVLEKLEGFIADIIGPEMARKYLPFLGSLFIFILLANYCGLLPLAGRLPGLAAPTSSLSVTAALALCVFAATHGYGLKEHGFNYFKHFTKPVIFIMPLLLIEEFVRPLSLSLRLFGNIFGEEALASQVFNLLPVLAPLPLFFLSILLGFVQAMVFTILAAIYISSAAGETNL